MASPTIYYNRGTTYSFTHVYEQNGVPATTGLKLVFTVKSAVDDDATDSAALVQKDLAMSGSSTVVTINPADIGVDSTDEDGEYVYDIKVLDSVAGIILLEQGVFALNVSATNKISF